MTLEFLPQAEQEVAEVTAYYEQTDPALATRFREEIESITATLLLHPLLWRQRSDGYRRVNLPSFPFYLAYVLRGERVRVIAVSHGARRPGYFRSRLRRPPAA